jgi:AAA+ ATPase superfamily predicted ATPase
MDTSDRIALGAAVISLLSFAATFVFAVLGRRYTRQQIEQTQDQIEETRTQFRAINTPDVEIEVYYQGADKRGVYLKATNHHPTITVNDLLVYVVGDSPSKKEAFTFYFLTFADLKPMQTLIDRSPVELERVLAEDFPAYDQSGAMITDRPIDSFDAFPMKLHYKFLSRLYGAVKVEGERDLYLLVMRKGS